jgi:hypothetical protein
MTRASKAPPGPATSIAAPPLLKMPVPITELITMNWKMSAKWNDEKLGGPYEDHPPLEVLPVFG